MHDRVRDVGNVCRIVGDTAGALAGGSIKAIGATVNVRWGFGVVLEGYVDLFMSCLMWFENQVPDELSTFIESRCFLWQARCYVGRAVHCR